MFDCWPASLDWRFPSSDCGLRQPVRTMILLFLSIAWCCPCRPTVCMASRVFDVLPTTYPSTTVLVIWQPCALQMCPNYDRLRLRTCPSSSRIMSSSCRMLSSVLSSPPAHFRGCYLLLIAHLQCASFCSVIQHRPYQCLNQSHCQCNWDGPSLPQAG